MAAALPSAVAAVIPNVIGAHSIALFAMVSMLIIDCKKMEHSKTSEIS